MIGHGVRTTMSAMLSLRNGSMQLAERRILPRPCAIRNVCFLTILA